MAKKVYKIPDTLDKNFADTEIALQSDGGIGARPMPIGYILLYVFSIIVWFVLISKTFISSGGIGLIILFSILWLILTMVLLKRDKTGIPQASLVVSMINYLPKNMRRIWTRNGSRANDFYNLAGIKSIDGAKGFIEFIDGTCGFMYRVVGTGSVLLFDEDRRTILDRCDSFYRKIKPDCELIYMTAKEPQKVARQIGACATRYENLKFRDAELEALADMNYKCLRDDVGTNYRSIHQYLIIKADNKEALTVAKNVLQSEVENSSMVFKQCAALMGDDINEVLATIYRGKESV